MVVNMTLLQRCTDFTEEYIHTWIQNPSCTSAITKQETRATVPKPIVILNPTNHPGGITIYPWKNGLYPYVDSWVTTPTSTTALGNGEVLQITGRSTRSSVPICPSGFGNPGGAYAPCFLKELGSSSLTLLGTKGGCFCVPAWPSRG